jgi:hypothetical protein
MFRSRAMMLCVELRLPGSGSAVFSEAKMSAPASENVKTSKLYGNSGSTGACTVLLSASDRQGGWFYRQSTTENLGHALSP